MVSRRVLLPPNKLRKAAFEGKFRLNPIASTFFVDMDLNVNLTQGRSAIVPSRFSFEAGPLPEEAYATFVPELDIEVEPTLRSFNGTTVLAFDIAKLFPNPYQGRYVTTGLASSRVTFSKLSVYVFELTFDESYFDPNVTRQNAAVSFTATFKYGPTRLGPITVKFTFYPKK